MPHSLSSYSPPDSPSEEGGTELPPTRILAPGQLQEPELEEPELVEEPGQPEEPGVDEPEFDEPRFDEPGVDEPRFAAKKWTRLSRQLRRSQKQLRQSLWQSLQQSLRQPGSLVQLAAQVFQQPQPTSSSQGWITALRPLLLVTLLTTGGIMLVRQAGGLQAWELRTYDLMMRLRSHPGPNPHLLVVEITEADIQQAQRWPITDEIFAQVLARLQRYQPRVIGLDIYRDFPQPPGNAALHQQLQQPNVIGIYQLPTPLDPNGVAPPPMPSPQLGFNDVLLDPDSVLRRSLLLTWDDETGNLEYSFAYRLADRYLQGEGIQPVPHTQEAYRFDWGAATLRPFFYNDGGYQRVQHDGWQLLLNYRAAENVARRVTLHDILEGRFDPRWVEDKVVLIGTTAISDKDFFLTPFTRSKQGGFDMAGVWVHAQMVGQLLDAALGDRPLLRTWPQGAELLVIVVCVGMGAALTGSLRNPLLLVGVLLGAIAILLLVSGGLFLHHIWLPMVTPVVGLISSSIAMLSYNNYQAQREQRILAERAAEQEQAILSLRMAAQRQEIASPQQPGASTAEAKTKIQTASPFQRDGIVANRYRIQQVLASGGFSITYVAQDTQRPGSPECVVKRLRPGRQDPQFLGVARRLFQAEAEILEILGRHDRIPQLLAYFEEGADFLLVEQLIQGHPLSQELPQDRRWPEAKVVNLLQELLPTLAFIHERQIIHRDIKPNNIIRRPDGALVLIDFGAVKQMKPQGQDRAAPQQTIAIGTQGYAAPEQLAGHPRFSSDLYALGVIAIRALTGIPPHMLEQDPDSGDLVWQTFVACDPSLSRILTRMAKYHFGDRYTSAEQVLQDLALLPHSD